MLPQHVLVALVAACSAVPLNINLGAYSPALVVGDGEISLGSTASASELMATLASGSTNGQGQAQGQPAKKQDAQPAPTEENAAKRAPVPNLVRTVDHIGKREAAEEHMAAIEGAMKWIKRDLAGFNAALGYAREAMKDAPKIEMGSEGAGVGIVVNAGLNVPANSAANGQPPAGKKKEKRAEVVEESDTPKMTLVAITEV